MDGDILDLDIEENILSDRKSGKSLDEELRKAKNDFIERSAQLTKSNEYTEFDDDDNTMANMLKESPTNEPSSSGFRRRSNTWDSRKDEFVPEVNPVNKIRSSGLTIELLDDNSMAQYIPDIDEIETDMYTTDMPNVTQKLISLQELENDISKNLELATLDGIDLSLLTKRLVSKSQLIEDDVPWTWDNLIGELALAVDIPDERIDN